MLLAYLIAFGLADTAVMLLRERNRLRRLGYLTTEYDEWTILLLLLAAAIVIAGRALASVFPAAF